jgi:anti-anti-sigma regulatory factor
MNYRETRRGGALILEVTDRALVRGADWERLAAFEGKLPETVVLDLGAAEFVSSLFWQSCVALGRELVKEGRRLALANLSEQHRQVLGLVDGSRRLVLLDGAHDLEQWLCTDETGRRGGVTDVEKRMLWH